MITIDDLHKMFRVAMQNNVAVGAIVTAGWLQDRQRQATTPTGEPYGVLRIKQTGTQRTSGIIFKVFSVTAIAYLKVESTNKQSDLQKALAILLDSKPDALTLPSGSHGVVSIIPADIDQKVLDEMKSGSDMTTVGSQWTVKTWEARV